MEHLYTLFSIQSIKNFTIILSFITCLVPFTIVILKVLQTNQFDILLMPKHSGVLYRHGKWLILVFIVDLIFFGYGYLIYAYFKDNFPVLISWLFSAILILWVLFLFISLVIWGIKFVFIPIYKLMNFGLRPANRNSKWNKIQRFYRKYGALMSITSYSIICILFISNIVKNLSNISYILVESLYLYLDTLSIVYIFLILTGSISRNPNKDQAYYMEETLNYKDLSPKPFFLYTLDKKTFILGDKKTYNESKIFYVYDKEKKDCLKFQKAEDENALENERSVENSEPSSS